MREQNGTPKIIIEKFQNRMIRLIEHNLDTAISQANTEAESTKDYIGRVVYEFFQNAVDRADKNIWMELTEDKFVISNDGKEFSIYENEMDNSEFNIYKDTDEKPKGDFHSLNSIHNGEKQAGESIGNKGVGFKSCWNVSEYVKIESVVKKNDDIKEAWGFELFNPVKAEYFQEQNIKRIIEAIEHRDKKIPSFYFPKYIESKKEKFENGAVTKITIVLKNNNAYTEIKKELKEFKETKFWFLNLLKGKEEKEYQICITIDGLITKIDSNYQKDLRKDLKSLSRNKENKCYREDYLQLLQARKKETYKNIPKKPNISIAFPSDDEVVGKFYTYLPTERECGFNVLIHADFALDNARKHIPENNYNKTILKIAAKMFVSELLNSNLYNYKNFAQFLIPKDKNDKFAELVWKELISDKRLTRILQKVYTKERDFSKQSYEKVFKVIEAWKIDGKQTDKYWQRYYDQVLQYFCNTKVYIVWIDENNKTFLPSKKETNKYEYSLFLKEKDDDKLDYSLLSDIKNLKITNFESLQERIELFKNQIIRKFSTLEILKVLKNYEHKNIIFFVKQLINNTKEELSQEIRKELLDIKIPVNEAFVEIKKCFINIDEEIKELLTDEFKEVNIDTLEGIDVEFLIKIDIANNRMPFYKKNKEIVLPFKENIKYPKSNKMKNIVLNCIDEDIIKKLGKIQWWYDEKKNELYKPTEVFLFKEHDNRKIESIGQEKKDKQYQELYKRFNIDEIDETMNSQKLINQLIKMKTFLRDSYHQEVYKKVTSTLSKIENIKNINIPILVTDMNKNSEIKYTSIDEKNKIIFLETKYKKYKEQLKENYSYLAHFDNNVSDKFLEQIGIQKFNPNYNIEYKDDKGNETTPQKDKEIKKFLQQEFLAPFFALANEIVGSKFEKEDSLKRWENLIIKKAYNVVLTINDKKRTITVSSTEKRNIDVLYIPIKDKHNRPTQIGEVAHDLDNFETNSNMRKFAQIFAEGIFRNMKLKSDFELYITAFLNNDLNLKNDIFINKGIEEVHILEMENFINTNLLGDNEKEALVKIFNELGIEMKSYQAIFDYNQYERLDMNFHNFKDKFSNKYQFIVQNLVDGYKSYYQVTLENLINQNKEELEVLCFIKDKKREVFENKLEKIKNKKINIFKQEFDVFKLFDVNKIDKKRDEYIKGMLDLEYYTDEIKDKKLNLERKTTSLQAKLNPSTGDAKKLNKTRREQEEKLEKRGLGQELKIAYEYAKKIIDKAAFINVIKEKIYVNDDDLKENINLMNYLNELDNYKEADNLTFAKNLIQIASHSLDGLGYDLIIPNSQYGILKVELKSTTQSDNIEIHFSKNEIERIIHYMNIDNYKIWLNNEQNDITDFVRRSVEEFQAIELPFYSNEYILKLGVLQ